MHRYQKANQESFNNPVFKDYVSKKEELLSYNLKIFDKKSIRDVFVIKVSFMNYMFGYDKNLLQFFNSENLSYKDSLQLYLYLDKKELFEIAENENCFFEYFNKILTCLFKEKLRMRLSYFPSIAPGIITILKALHKKDKVKYKNHCKFLAFLSIVHDLNAGNKRNVKYTLSTEYLTINNVVIPKKSVVFKNNSTGRILLNYSKLDLADYKLCIKIINLIGNDTDYEKIKHTMKILSTQEFINVLTLEELI